MKHLLLIAAAALSLTACGPVELSDPRTAGEIAYPPDLQASYTCSIDQWEMVKRRIDVCEAQGWGSKPFVGCPNVAILAECTWKGEEIDNPPLTSPN